MSELETFRDHCRAMAEWKPPVPHVKVGAWCRDLRAEYPNLDTEGWGPPKHENCFWAKCACDCHPRPAGPSESDRALFARLADEVDAYLATDDEPALFETTPTTATPEPEETK